MVRVPCCEKMGMKRGPWTAEEDQALINFISLYGHGNWRALPKQAGLMRCGKSCRLRWSNYLRPDIKRGNFTTEEEDTIMNLHQLLGNRWSAIAARLPGRTDNEIKNVWHTHLKKRLVNKQATSDTISKPEDHKSQTTSNTTSRGDQDSVAITCNRLSRSPQPYSITDVHISSNVYCTSENENNLVLGSTFMKNNTEFLENIDDERFWSDAALSTRNKPSSTVVSAELHGMDFWYEMFDGSRELLFVSDII